MNRLPAFLPHDIPCNPPPPPLVDQQCDLAFQPGTDPEADHFKDVPACEIGFAEADLQKLANGIAHDNNPFRTGEIYVTCLIKGAERYVFMYDDSQEVLAATLRVVGRYASNKELSFSWFDAAVVSQRIRATVNAGK